MNQLDQHIIRFGVLGYGRIGHRHGAIINSHTDGALVSVCDINPAQLEKSKVFGAAVYNDIHKFLASDMDVVNICTPNGLHAEQALAVLRQNKHVVIEKPMGLDRRACEAVIHEAMNRSLKVFCVMQNRYSPSVAWLKTFVEEGKLGEIRMVEMSCFWNRDERYYFPQGQPHPWHGSLELDGGVLYTQFSHFIDLLYWIFGDIDVISSVMSKQGDPTLTDLPEDSGVVTFRLQKGGLGSFTFTTAVANKNLESSVTIIGEKGSIKLGGQYMDQIVEFSVENEVLPELAAAAAPNDYGNYKGSAANHHFIIQNVIDTLNRGDMPTTNALEGLKVVDLIQRMYEQSNVGSSIKRLA